MAGIIEVKDQGKLRIYDADNSHYVDIVVPSSVTANRTITIPDASFTVPQVTNATHSGEVTGATALTIADNIVDEANLKVSNSAVNGYMLTAQSGNTGGLTWATAPTSVAGTLSFQAYRSSNLTLAATTTTEIVFNAEKHDGSSKYDTSTGRYTPGVAGTYFVTANVSYDPGASVSTAQNAYLKIRKNNDGGNGEYGQMSFSGSGGQQNIGFSTSAIIELGSSDYISCNWYGTIAGVALSVQSWFSGYRLD